MEAGIILGIVTIIITLVTEYLQIVKTFVKGEVKFIKRFPFVIQIENNPSANNSQSVHSSSEKNDTNLKFDFKD